MRPSFGGPGIPTPQPRSQGSMGVLMPMYTIGIIIFFVYTTMKIIFKKSEDNNPANDPLYSRKLAPTEDTSIGPNTARYRQNYVSEDDINSSLYLTKKIHGNKVFFSIRLLRQLV